MLDYARIWQRIDKVVYSTTLDGSRERQDAHRARLRPGAVPRMKQSPRGHGIGGPNLAAAAFAAGLVDEVRLFVLPIVVGGGKAALPSRVALELHDERRFESGTVYLCYGMKETGTLVVGDD